MKCKVTKSFTRIQFLDSGRLVRFRNGARNKRCDLCSCVDMERRRQCQPFGIGRRRQEGFDLVQMQAVCQADIEMRRTLPEQAVERHAHGQVAAAAEAAWGNANDLWGSAAVEQDEGIAPACEAFKDHGGTILCSRRRDQVANGRFPNSG